MAHDEEVVRGWIERASPLMRQWVAGEPLKSLQRLDAIQALVDEYGGVLEGVLFDVIFERLGEQAETVAGRCPVCRFKCERSRSTVRVRTTRRTLEVGVWRYRCRACRTNRSPVREWLGLESGATTAGLDRALTALSTQMSFGAAAQQMLEQHGHEVDRTLVERRTYAVGRDAATYLEERDTERLREVMDTWAFGAESSRCSCRSTAERPPSASSCGPPATPETRLRS